MAKPARLAILGENDAGFFDLLVQFEHVHRTTRHTFSATDTFVLID